MKKFGKILIIAAAFMFALTMTGCKNGANDDNEEDNKSEQQTTEETTPVQVPATYTITFNANDGSENPATATQEFQERNPFLLKSIDELGFSKQNYPFLGWLTAPDATEVSYEDHALYTATKNTTLYALWSSVPFYNINIDDVSNGSVIASKTSAAEGDEITITADWIWSGYEIDTIAVTAEDGTSVTVTTNDEDNTIGSFIMPAQDVTVTATFKKSIYNIKIDDTMTNGTVKVGKIKELPYAIVITAKPDKGYELDEYIVTQADGLRIGVIELGGEYTGSARFFMPSQDVTVSATFKPSIYDVEAYAMDGHGSVTKSKANAKMNEEITITATSNTGYELDYFYYVDEDTELKVPATGTKASYTFNMPASYVRVLAYYKSILYNVNVDSVSNGSITVNQSTSKMGSEITIEARPDLGYEFTSFSVTADDGSVIPTNGTGKKQTFIMPVQNVTVSANFMAKNYTVTCGPFENGIVKADKTETIIGSTVTLTIEPDIGYELTPYSLNVKTSGGMLLSVAGTDNTRTFTMPANNVTVTASFRAIYRIDVGTMTNGSITPSKTSALKYDTITLTVSPNEGYELDSCIVTAEDGSSVSVEESSWSVEDRRFTMPAQNVTVTATFKEKNYNISIAPYRNGNVSVSKTMAKMNEEISLTVTPNEGYELTSLSLTASDGSTITPSTTDDTMKFKMPAKAVTVTASFSAINYTIFVPSFFANGSVSANLSTAKFGDTVTLTATPADSYKLDNLKVYAEDKTTVTTSVKNNVRTFKMPSQNVAIDATFVEHATASGDYNRLGSVSINAKSYDMVTFGLWPQTIIATNVAVDENVTETHGAFTYCKGEDGEWYVKQPEKGFIGNKTYTYSNGNIVEQGGTSYKWFKVEPIKWRVLNVNASGDKLLLAESILTSGIPYYLQTNNRNIGENVVYANNYKYSTIRAYLNGEYETGDTQSTTYLGKGFLQNAFTSAQQDKIKPAFVDNSSASTMDVGEINEMATKYACDSTKDKIFLLSAYQITFSDYGFVTAISSCDSRIRSVTDFALATGAFLLDNSTKAGYWWLRSPGNNSSSCTWVVYQNGNTDSYPSLNVKYGDVGVVPALLLSK